MTSKRDEVGFGVKKTHHTERRTAYIILFHATPRGVNRVQFVRELACHFAYRSIDPTPFVERVDVVSEMGSRGW